MNEKAIPFRQIEPGIVITQGRGGQAIIQDTAGSIFLTTKNITGSNQETLSVNDSISSITLLSGEAPIIINTEIQFPSNNFNTISYEQTPIPDIQIIKPVYNNTTSSLELTVDISPTQSITQTNVISNQIQETPVDLTLSLFLPEEEESFYPLYDTDVLGLEAESYHFLVTQSTPIQSIVPNTPNIPSISSTDIETEEVIKAILQGLNIPVNLTTITFMKAWRQSEGGSATWNLLNSTLSYNGSTIFNKVKVQNYKSKQDGIAANIITLKSPKYSKIVEGLKNIKSLKDGYDLATILSDGPSDGPFYVWSLGYYNRILKLCARGNSIYNENKLCPPPKSIKNKYIANILNFWIINNKINFTNFIKKTK
jgi:hypothetical protein